MARLVRFRPALLLGVLAAGLVVAALIGTVANAQSSAPLAPNFTLTDIYGHNFTLSNYRNSSVVVIEFTSLSCSACQIIEKSLANLYAGYNHTGNPDVRIISVYIEPGFGDTVANLKTYHQTHNITWTMAQDTPSLAVMTAYGAQDIPVIAIVDEHGYATFKWTASSDGGTLISQATLQSQISNALGGHATPISIVSVSVFALAVVAGVTTFFSPCAFPMFPGYMSLYLGLNQNVAARQGGGSGQYAGATRRALGAGTVTAVGMMVVFLVISLVLLVTEGLVDRYIPYLLIIVGAVLIGLGALLLTNLQYWRIVTPLQNLWGRIRGAPTGAEAAAIGAPADGRGLYVKLFGYGMGYAAAASGCVAPVILAVVTGGAALGLVGGLTTILIFGLTAALLMVGVTVALGVAGQRYVNKLKAYTPIIKKVSAAALVIVGVYLVYFYYTAWIA